MSVVLTVLGYALLGVLIVVMLAAILPLQIELALCRRDRWCYHAALRPFAGLGPSVALRNGRRKSGDRDRKATGKTSKHRRIWQSDPMRVLDAGQRLLETILRHVRIHAADVDMTFGFRDPADTGQAFGLLAPAIFGIRAVRRAQVQVNPVFDRAVLRGRADLRLSLVPVLLLLPLVRFGWSLFGARR